MRVFALSDLHLERRAPESVAVDADFDVLVCAGDVWEGEPERGVEAVARLARGRPALLVPGNHDHYGGARAYPEMLAAQAEAARRHGIPVLSGGASATIDGVRFVGATLWSDWSLGRRWAPPGAGDPAARAAAHVLDPATGSREYRGAITGEGGRVWSPADAMAAHAADKAALAAALAMPHPGPVVAVTHHPPLVEIVDAYRDWPGVPWWLPAFYGTQALAELPEASRPDLWISGHFHARHDRRVGRTRCVANPVEGGTFDPRGTVEL
jgi:Icc-related predicted phosphoesterase